MWGSVGFTQDFDGSRYAACLRALHSPLILPLLPSPVAPVHHSCAT